MCGHKVYLIKVCIYCVLIVVFLCAVAGQAPVMSVEPRAATVRKGESVSFRCNVKLTDSNPRPLEVQWKKANNQALPGQDRQHVKTITIVQHL